MALFLLYLEARLRRQGEGDLFRVYLTDCQKGLLDALTGLAGGRTMTRRFCDMLLEPKPREQRSGEEIARDVIARAGIEVIEHGSV